MGSIGRQGSFNYQPMAEFSRWTLKMPSHRNEIADQRRSDRSLNGVSHEVDHADFVFSITRGARAGMSMPQSTSHAQVKLRHEVFMASGGDFDSLLKANGVKTIIPHQRKIPHLLKALFGLHRTIGRCSVDVVHAHVEVTSAVIAFPICKLRGVPLITVHNEFEKRNADGTWHRVIAVGDVVNLDATTGCASLK